MDGRSASREIWRDWEERIDNNSKIQELETGDRERESWRLVIGRERVGDW